MTITTAQYKAAIEAKIAAANGSTTLKDLSLIKTNADLWLLNNPAGSISGYATLEGLIQTIQNALTSSSTLNDVSFVGVSAFPPQPISAGGNYENSTLITTSGAWTVPADVFKLKVFATGGGGGGGGSITGDGPTPGSGGGAGGTAISELMVTPGQVLNIIIGAGGVGVNGLNGTVGGETFVRINTAIIAYGRGGSAGVKNSNVATNQGTASSLGSDIINGGGGGGGGVTGGGSPPAQGGRYAFVGSTIITTILATNSGLGGTVTGGGGGGGCSYYGQGGTGGNGVSINDIGFNGSAPTSTHYGAGGGGAGGSNGSGGATGGNGIAGAVEIYY